MANTLTPSTDVLSPVQHKSLSVNGQEASPALLTRAKRNINHGITRVRRCVLSASNYGDSGLDADFHFKFTSGPDIGADSYQVVVRFAVNPAQVLADNPQVYFTLNGSSSDKVHIDKIDSSGPTDLLNQPDNWALYEVSKTITPDTTYEGKLVLANISSARLSVPFLISAVGYEVANYRLDKRKHNALDETNLGHGAPILDDGVLRPFESIDNGWRYNAASLIQFSIEDNSSAGALRINDTETWINPLDDSEDGSQGDDSSIGWWIPISYRYRNKGVGKIPYKGHAYVDGISLSGWKIQFRLIDQQGIVNGSTVEKTGTAGEWVDFSGYLQSNRADDDGFLHVYPQIRITEDSGAKDSFPKAQLYSVDVYQYDNG